ncbi:MAG: 2-amino-4-hydroxy-6-hydroxymethyldihydropteridine diphosphokinase [Planctomycetota bacterium]|nr:2-amino-4-hydroxy-6-hydroxymethyldihydropteridine diphosphokinase [Planctomycetaceae bacterium]MDQ3332495.1 2-amino-4-hydroxy-6-hydroxymethyldihydropteridine diphosphokinase [Planctomycetota bacterium]
MADEQVANRVYFSLGSNIEAEKNLPAAVRQLQAFGNVAATSTVYETLPVGFADQPNFLNAAALLETPHTLAEILDVVVPAVERSLARVRDPAHPDGPRTIDLDVLLFNDVITRTERHTLPDPDILKHAFVAVPLAELDPSFLHPVTHETLATIAARLPIAAGDMRPRTDVRLA